MSVDRPYRRRERLEADGAAHFLTFSCFGRQPLLANDAIKDRFVERLATIECARFLAWVVMPEHVHLILVPVAPAQIRDVMQAIKRPFALEILNRWRSLEWHGLARVRDEKGHHFWQEGGGYDRLVHGHELREKIAYTHANPCRRGLVGRSIDYRWSSAAAYEGLPSVGPPIEVDLVPRGGGPLV